MKYLIRASISSHLVLEIHAYIPELTVTLTKYYRNIKKNGKWNNKELYVY